MRTFKVALLLDVAGDVAERLAIGKILDDLVQFRIGILIAFGLQIEADHFHAFVGVFGIDQMIEDLGERLPRNGTSGQAHVPHEGRHALHLQAFDVTPHRRDARDALNHIDAALLGEHGVSAAAELVERRDFQGGAHAADAHAGVIHVLWHVDLFLTLTRRAGIDGFHIAPGKIGAAKLVVGHDDELAGGFVAGIARADIDQERRQACEFAFNDAAIFERDLVAAGCKGGSRKDCAEHRRRQCFAAKAHNSILTRGVRGCKRRGFAC